MAKSKPGKRAKTTSSRPASSPGKLVKNLKLSEKNQKSVVGGRKAGKGQQEFLIIKMNDVLISSVNP